MRFWDSSAIVPLLFREADSAPMREAFESDPHQVVWWATSVEVVSAISRREHEGKLDANAAESALATLRRMAVRWDTVEPSPIVRSTAMRLLRTNEMRAADALQLASTLVVAGDDPESVTLVTLDDRLADAARREGLTVLEMV